jgi:hypothetical protein
MAAGAASSEENPSSRSRKSAAHLFESREQAPMCIRACPGEAIEENPSSKANPEHSRGTRRRQCAFGRDPERQARRTLQASRIRCTGGVRGEIPRQSENSRLIPVVMATSSCQGLTVNPVNPLVDRRLTVRLMRRVDWTC